MSNDSSAQPDFDFWEFVHCSKCQLPFSADGAPTIPFWLTECGHVVCNNHLNPDQSCVQCRTPGIEVVPLQREMDAPMSDWFRPIPAALDVIVYAAKFQQEAMASQIRYYRSRHHQLRVFIERLKCDVVDLKKSNETLLSENERLRQQMSRQTYTAYTNDGQVPSDFMAVNGKRRMVSAEHHEVSRPRTNSSPHAAAAAPPLAPNRLTIHPTQQTTDLSSNGQVGTINSNIQSNSGGNAFTAHSRPSSSRLMHQYSYVPPETPQMPPPRLSHAQAATKVFQRSKESMGQSDGQQATSTGPTAFLPVQSRFKPASGPSVSSMASGQGGLVNIHSSQHLRTNTRQTNMGPPPTPRHVRQQKSRNFSNQSNSKSNAEISGFSLDNISSLHQGRRFVPQSQMSTQNNQHFTGPLAASQTPLRVLSNTSRGNQRTAFIPGKPNSGFG